MSGTIKTNGHPRQLKFFNKLSSYIMQEDLIQPFLTVQEAMEVAANLKLGDELKFAEKLLAVSQYNYTFLGAFKTLWRNY